MKFDPTAAVSEHALAVIRSPKSKPDDVERAMGHLAEGSSLEHLSDAELHALKVRVSAALDLPVPTPPPTVPELDANVDDLVERNTAAMAGVIRREHSKQADLLLSELPTDLTEVGDDDLRGTLERLRTLLR